MLRIHSGSQLREAIPQRGSKSFLRSTFVSSPVTTFVAGNVAQAARLSVSRAARRSPITPPITNRLLHTTTNDVPTKPNVEEVPHLRGNGAEVDRRQLEDTNEHTLIDNDTEEREQA